MQNRLLFLLDNCLDLVSLTWDVWPQQAFGIVLILQNLSFTKEYSIAKNFTRKIYLMHTLNRSTFLSIFKILLLVNLELCQKWWLVYSLRRCQCSRSS